MLSILTAVAAGLLAVAFVWGGYLWYRRRVDPSHEDITAEFLVGLGRGLGLDYYTERTLFGEEIKILAGEFRDLYVELEVSHGRWDPYLRIVYEFDQPLARDVAVFSDDRSGIVSYVQRVREIEVGEDEFDYKFLLYAQDPDSVRKLLPEATRYQMLRLDSLVDELRLTDNSLFVLVSNPVDQERLRRILKKGTDLADRIQTTADELGPRRPESAAATYEQATIEQAVRTDTGRGTTTDDAS